MLWPGVCLYVFLFYRKGLANRAVLGHRKFLRLYQTLCFISKFVLLRNENRPTSLWDYMFQTQEDLEKYPRHVDHRKFCQLEATDTVASLPR